ncbi:hypothetical protein [Palleronia sp. LCG004]|uniref:hypothetical protein n=1 Tax=Palleronia sp. LCG004 TaxID=3079304 RepID=UPI002942DFA7|nr:hypothetical protein [Palleronia sp. LCG004]WOI55116.1 hypothetical protein RVY76_08585 [Palleronia sp. LCG004]
MASPGELQKKVAVTLGIDDVEAATTWRVLREAGLVTKGGRGRSAARVTHRDAATLIYAICGSTMIKEAPAFINRATSSRGFNHYLTDWAPVAKYDFNPGEDPESPKWELRGLDVPSVKLLPSAHSALDVLEGFLLWGGEAQFADEVVKPSETSVKRLFVSFELPDEITRFRVSGVNADDWKYFEEQYYAPSGGYHYDGRTISESEKIRLEGDGHPIRTGDLESVRWFSLHTIQEIGRFLEARPK